MRAGVKAKVTTVSLAALFASFASGNVVLIGSDIPNPSVLGGDFEEFRANWRRPEQSPHWTTKVVKGGGRIGFADGTLMINGPELATAESRVLDHTGLESLTRGDVLAWRFAANAEYPCAGRVTLALVFGDREHVVTRRVKVPTGPEKPQIYEGFYTVTAEDAAVGMPRVKFTLESSHNIIVYVHWLDMKLLQDDDIPELAANVVEEGIELTLNEAVGLDRRASRVENGGRPGGPSLPFDIFRSEEERTGFELVAEGVKGNHWTDSSIISGKIYYYAVKQGTSVSPVIKARKVDSVPPSAPQEVRAAAGEWTTSLSWKTTDSDIEYYKVYRASGGTMVCIAPYVKRNGFEDQLPLKGADNVYAVQAVDYSGNESAFSKTSSARTKAVRGASFSDLILPMPIHKQLRSDVWGGDNVRPRDPDNGVEDCDWSYWGGKVVKDPADGKYHLNVVRWPESDRKGHWAWPHSTVAYAVADSPTGLFRVVRDRAYEYRNGLGHNANIIPLNDGRYAMYSLIDWKPMILTADRMAGPWNVLGELHVNLPDGYPVAYRLVRNLSGVQCEDDSFLFVTKAGAMIRSTEGILGSYEVVSDIISENSTIPAQYRKFIYEDPTMWYDGVQYHMIINAFVQYRAIYLRSPDGIHWKYEDGLAYTPSCTVYEDGTRTFWYKMERPNVLQDEYGRATHLSLAVIDIPKADDYGNDNHSSKHIILPLTVPRRLTMLNKEPVTADAKEIRLLIHSEEEFDARADLDLDSLRFGGSETVNFGDGSRLKATELHPDGVILVFDGANNGITEKNFTGKLIGQTRSGKLVVGYSKLSSE